LKTGLSMLKKKWLGARDGVIGIVNLAGNSLSFSNDC